MRKITRNTESTEKAQYYASAMTMLHLVVGYRAHGTWVDADGDHLFASGTEIQIKGQKAYHEGVEITPDSDDCFIAVTGYDR